MDRKTQVGIKQTFTIRPDLIEKIRARAYQDRTTKSELVNHALIAFLEKGKERKRADKAPPY